MSKSARTILISSVLFIVIFLLLVSMVAWQIALMISTGLLFLLAILIRIVPSAFLSASAFRQDSDAAVLDSFNSLLKDVFMADTVLTSMDTSQPYQILINQKHFVIGRDKSCDYVLPLGQTISRRHVRISYQEGSGEYIIMDLDTANGTTINGEPLTAGRAYSMKKGDKVCFAGIQFTVKSAYY